MVLFYKSVTTIRTNSTVIASIATATSSSLLTQLRVVSVMTQLGDIRCPTGIIIVLHGESFLFRLQRNGVELLFVVYYDI